MAVVTNGGGPGVLAADEVALNGLDLADLPQELIAELDERAASLLEQAQSAGSGGRRLRRVGLKALELVARCDTVDAVLALNFLGVPSTVGEERKRSRTGSTRASRAWETVASRASGRADGGDRQAHHQRPRPSHLCSADGAWGDPRSLLSAGAFLASRRRAGSGRMAWYGEYRAGLK